MRFFSKILAKLGIPPLHPQAPRRPHRRHWGFRKYA